MKGTLSLTLWISLRERGTSAVPAMARKWSTALVEPLGQVSKPTFNWDHFTHPRAMVMTRAFSNDSLVIRSRGRIFFSMQILIASAAFSHSLILAGDSAGVDEEPGRVRPIASMAVDMVLAVNMPLHAPAPGQACRSRSSITSLGLRPFSPGHLAAWSLP